MQNNTDLDITIAHLLDRGLVQLQYAEETRRILNAAAKRTSAYLESPNTRRLLKADPEKAQRWAAAQKALAGLGSKEKGICYRFLTPKMADSCLFLFAAANKELNRNGKKWKYSVSVTILLAQVTPREVGPMTLPLLQNPWIKDKSIDVYEGFSVALRNDSRWFSIHELVLAWMILCKYKGSERGIAILRRKLALLTVDFRDATEGL